jgi:hypothetical protein
MTAMKPARAKASAARRALEAKAATAPSAAPPTRPFDPWTMTTAESLSLPMDLDNPRSHMWQYLEAKSITARREAIEKGSGYDVLETIARCAQRGLSIPAWLADLYLPRFKAVKFHSVASWDDGAAFGKPHRKGTHLARLRKDEAAGSVIVAMVRHILTTDPSRAIDESVFEEVSARFDKKERLGKTECARIYYLFAPKMENTFGPMPSKSKR